MQHHETELALTYRGLMTEIVPATAILTIVTWREERP